jgi:hypothetical protein
MTLWDHSCIISQCCWQGAAQLLQLLQQRAYASSLARAQHSRATHTTLHTQCRRSMRQSTPSPPASSRACWSGCVGAMALALLCRTPCWCVTRRAPAMPPALRAAARACPRWQVADSKSDAHKEAERLRLKQLSEERAAKWPNTLQVIVCGRARASSVAESSFAGCSCAGCSCLLQAVCSCARCSCLAAGSTHMRACGAACCRPRALARRRLA